MLNEQPLCPSGICVADQEEKVLISCPYCDKQYKVKRAFLGKHTTCGECQNRFTLSDDDGIRRTSTVLREDDDPYPTAFKDASAATPPKQAADSDIKDTTSAYLAEHFIEFHSDDADKRYSVDGEIARGGMGAILLSRDVNLHRKVAMKVALSKKASKSQLRRFVEEAQVTGQLEHPNIVPIYELGMDSAGQLFYTMKMVRGRTLEDIITQLARGDQETLNKFNLTVLLDIFTRICDALIFAHSKDVIHRDLKPENIMIGDYGEVLVMDWGLAKILPSKPEEEISIEDIEAVDDSRIVKTITSESTLRGTMEGSLVGTPQFMSPEQANGQISKLSPASDIYSLGAILYEMLTLRPSVEGKNVDEVLDKVAEGRIKPPEFYNSSSGGSGDTGKKDAARKYIKLRHCPNEKIPTSLSAVCMQAMRYNIEDRYQSVRALKKDIQAYLHGYATEAENPDALRQISLLIQRHKRECVLIAASLLIIIGLVLSFVHDLRAKEADAQMARIEAEGARDDAQKQQARAEQSLADLKNTVPVFVGRAKQYINTNELEAAMETLNLALQIDPHHADCWALKGNIFQSQMEFEKSLSAYEKSLNAQENKEAKLNIDISKTMIKRKKAKFKGEPYGTDDLLYLYQAFIDQGRSREAIVVLAKLKGESRKVLLSWDAIFKKMVQNGDMKSFSLRQDEDGLLTLNMTGLKRNDLSFLKGMPIKTLLIPRYPKISDITPLADLPLQKLDLEGTSVFDLSPLRHLKLNYLRIGNTKVKDVSVLKGMPLEHLRMQRVPVTSIEFLRDAPIRQLDIRHVPVADLSPLRGKKLTEIYLGGSGVLTDLSVLRDMPIEYFYFDSVKAEGLGDLNVLKNMPLKELVTKHYRGNDLSLLKGKDLKLLEMFYAYNLINIDALRNMPLEKVTFRKCHRLKDVTPLISCPKLYSLVLYEGFEDYSFVKKMPGLKFLGEDFTGAIPLEDFLKKKKSN